ncbi:MAG: SURF1 family protein [Rhodospirillales bacterium]
MTKRFRFALWPTLFTIPAVIMMLGFGVWQVERLAWKNDLIERLQTRTAAAPVPLDQLSGKPADDEYRQIKLRGRFDHAHEMHLIARSLNGNTGYHIITPLILDDGRAVLVNRGWVPDERKDPARRAEGQVPGIVDVVAVTRLSQIPGWVTPNNQPAKNVWLYVDVAAMRQAGGIASSGSDYWFSANAAPNPGGYPIGGQTQINLPNDHLQYAFTWFAFAVILSVIYLIYSRNLARTPAQNLAQNLTRREPSKTP